MNIEEQTIKGLYENQDTAIKLLNENIELKKRLQLQENILDDVVTSLTLIKEDRGCIITDNDIKDCFLCVIENYMDKIVKEVEDRL